MLVSFSKGHVAWGKKKGTDGVRTRDLRFLDVKESKKMSPKESP